MTFTSLGHGRSPPEYRRLRVEKDHWAEFVWSGIQVVQQAYWVQVDVSGCKRMETGMVEG
jgi:hypothetical protein